MHWSHELKVKNNALNEIIRALTDDELMDLKDRICNDETVGLKDEAISILDYHLKIRTLVKQLDKIMEKENNV